MSLERKLVDFITLENSLLQRSSVTQAHESKEGDPIVLRGRVVAIRDHKKLIFADLIDETGSIQLVFSKQVQERAEIKLGDIVTVKGEMMKTKVGTFSLQVKECTVDVLCQRPIPDKNKGFTDIGERYKRRHLDLLANTHVREFIQNCALLKAGLRSNLYANGFLEFETGTLQGQFDAGLAQPFITHFNALSRDYYLRLTHEIRLKQIMVGGFERVFAMGSSFRNEGISHLYNPEFTLLETYQSYATHEDCMQLFESILTTAVQHTYGQLNLTTAAGQLDLRQPWQRVHFFDDLSQVLGAQITAETSKSILVTLAKKLGDFDEDMHLFTVYMKLFEQHLAPRYLQPTYFLGIPAHLSPLVANEPHDPLISQRSWFVIDGIFCGDIYTDQNNADLFITSLTEQVAITGKKINYGFIEALEYGLPQTAGMGIGIDRLLLAFRPPGIRKDIKEAILFPNV